MFNYSHIHVPLNIFDYVLFDAFIERSDQIKEIQLIRMMGVMFGGTISSKSSLQMRGMCS
jgi:hypothetical protein